MHWKTCDYLYKLHGIYFKCVFSDLLFLIKIENLYNCENVLGFLTKEILFSLSGMFFFLNLMYC